MIKDTRVSIVTIIEGGVFILNQLYIYYYFFEKQRILVEQLIKHKGHFSEIRKVVKVLY